MFKRLIVILLLILTIAQANEKFDVRLDKYPEAKLDYVKATNDKDQSAAFDLALFYENKLKDNAKAIEWYKKSYDLGSGSAAYNLGLLYDIKEKKYQDAIKWYKKAYLKENISGAALNLGVVYKSELKDYNKAIRWYTKAYNQGNMGGANGLGYIYDIILKDEKKGIFWYKKGAKGGNAGAINNLGKLYNEKGDKITSSAYVLAMINYGFTKKQVFTFLKNKRNIDTQTLKKAYKLQLTLDIPKHYTGGID